jgi:hypothetical protein
MYLLKIIENNDRLNLQETFSKLVVNSYFMLPLVDAKGYKTGQSGELFGM